MNRTAFQELAQLRLDDAAALLNGERAEAAYYLAGYAVECALKACIAKNTKEHDFPPDRKIIETLYTHELSKLLNAAGLKPALDRDAPQGSALDVNWGIVFRWSEQSRYERRTLQDARDLYNAITDQQDGVFKWLQRNW